MGSAESREGRRASFGMDEEERVRVLQGIRLSENVVNRMKEPGQPSRVGPPAPPAAALGSSGGREKGRKASRDSLKHRHTRGDAGGKVRRLPSRGRWPRSDSKPPRPDCSSGRGPPRVQVDPLERCDWEQPVLQDELVRVATADRQAAVKPRGVTLRCGEGGVDQEQQRLAQRARELESQEAELRRRDAFYKEQLGRLERQATQGGARVLRAAGPDPALLPRPPAGGAALRRPGEGLPALRQLCTQGLMEPRPGPAVTWSLKPGPAVRPLSRPWLPLRWRRHVCALLTDK
uniref:MICOS complex subunit MIC25 n=1 Tax=Capra hircus TaxID=9925 RepID=A0A8C2S3J7_CAPHI